MIKGSHHTEEFKKRMSEVHKGRIPWNKGLTKETDERIKKISEMKIGHDTWNKGLKGQQTAWNKGLTKEIDERIRQYGKTQQGKIISKDAKYKMSIAKKGKSIKKGRYFTKEHREKLSKAHIGIPLSEECKRNKSEAVKGEKCHFWKGGITPLHQIIRRNFKYRQWRSDVFTRDDFICQECKQRGGKLNAHHIKSFSSILQYYEITTIEEALECEELWNINNGVTLCVECHYKLRGEEDEFNTKSDSHNLGIGYNRQNR